MDARRVVAAHPVPLALSLASLLALAATVAHALAGGSLANTIRLAALTTVLAAFALGFWAGPIGERYL